MDLTNVRPVQDSGNLGQNIVVAMIDTGTSRFATALCDGPCETGTRVIGGESFVPGEPDATAIDNHSHGTNTATVVGANALFQFDHSSQFATAVRTYCPGCAFDVVNHTFIPMVGQAPAVKFYALKVFDRQGGSSPESRVAQAMERAIELKISSIPNLRVVNMSLGGPTIFPGGDLFQAITDAMNANGISVIMSSGNSGPSTMTVGSPGTSRNTVAVGAASNATYDRIAYYSSTGQDGYLSRPTDTEEITYFSSRGPNADGRVDPELVANGQNTWMQNPNNTFGIGSGTSFSAPVISGIAALMYNHNPAATPLQIRAALMLSARPDVISNATIFDQGRGYVDASRAIEVLDTNPAPIPDEGFDHPMVIRNLEQATGVSAVDQSVFAERFSDISSGERAELYYWVERGTQDVSLTFSNFQAELPPGQQNPLFGDRLIVGVHNPELSAGGTGEYLLLAYVTRDTSLNLTDLEPGVLRVTLFGAVNNVGRIATIDVSGQETRRTLARPTFRGRIGDGESRSYSYDVPAGTRSLRFELYWPHDWTSFPTNDLDLVITTPSGVVDTQGATLRDPERASFTNPQPGTYQLEVQGAAVERNGRREPYEIRVTLQ